MRKNYLSVCAGFALVTCGAALAQIPAPMGPAPGRSDLGTLDRDRDGSISRTEATMNPTLSAQFPMLDKNSNGALEPAEFARFESEAGMGRVPTHPGNPPATLQLDTNTPAPMTTPPPMNSTPPPMDRTPPPLESTPPPLGTSPPPPAPKPSSRPGSSYSPRSATSAGGPGDED